MSTQHKRHLSRRKRRKNITPEDLAALLPPAPLTPEDEAAILRDFDAILAAQKKQRKP